MTVWTVADGADACNSVKAYSNLMKRLPDEDGDRASDRKQASMAQFGR